MNEKEIIEIFKKREQRGRLYILTAAGSTLLSVVIPLLIGLYILASIEALLGHSIADILSIILFLLFTHTNLLFLFACWNRVYSCPNCKAQVNQENSFTWGTHCPHCEIRIRE